MNDRVTKKVIIDAYRGGDDIGNNVNGIVEKDYNLSLSKYIYDRLKTLGIPVALTRNDDETLDIDNRVSRIKSIYGTGNDVIVLSNALATGGAGGEIVYALRNSSGLSKKIADELVTAGVNVSKYYQRRLPSDTSLDYNQLIRDTKNNESLIVYYGNIDNVNEANYLKNNLEDIGEAIVIALADYLNVDYVPIIGNNYYIVKNGDSLYGIANANNTTVSELKELNNLETNIINIGQVLKIPSGNEMGNFDNGGINDNNLVYTVVSGDSLYSIAKQYGTTVDEIKRLNNLGSNLLSIGQKLNIPDNNGVNNNNLVYTVVSGDSLYSIAKQYGTTVDEIKRLNKLNSNLLSIGQKLKIPDNNGLVYTVVSGDSLYSIAKRYGTTVDEIKRLNNLSSNLLSIGQKLEIPS